MKQNKESISKWKWNWKWKWKPIWRRIRINRYK